MTRGEIATPAGVHLATLHWGGRGRALYLLHATGFCGALWDPIARGLCDLVSPRAIDARGHGRSDKPDAAYPWGVFADDLLAWLARESSGPVSALGHSSGATAILIAAARAPERFSRILLVDPSLLRPPAEQDEAERSDPFGLATRAGKRRAEFASLDELRAALRPKPPYRLFTDEVFELFCAHAVEIAADGRARLRCPPEIESRVYAGAAAIDPWAELGRIRARTRVVIPALSGLRPELQARLAKGLPHAELISTPGTHFLALENPDLVLAQARDFFGGE